MLIRVSNRYWLFTGPSRPEGGIDDFSCSFDKAVAAYYHFKWLRDKLGHTWFHILDMKKMEKLVFMGYGEPERFIFYEGTPKK